MYKSELFNNIINQAKKNTPVKAVIVNPVDQFSLGGVIEAVNENLISPILCGNKNEILKVADSMNEDISAFEIINCETEDEVLSTAMKLCRDSKVKLLMKGRIHTDHLMRAVVNKTTGLRTDRQISHVFALGLPSYHKLLYITDCALNIAPTVEQKEKIIINAVELLQKVGISKPKVGALSATEVLHPKIQSSLDANVLATNKYLQEKCIIEGPLAFDTVISKYAAEIKGISSNIAGDVDLLVVPNIESGNILFKSLVYLTQADLAGIILGAKIPIVLTSRADTPRARFLSVALACATSS